MNEQQVAQKIKDLKARGYNIYRFAINSRLTTVEVYHEGELVDRLRRVSEKRYYNEIREEYEGCRFEIIRQDNDTLLTRYQPDEVMEGSDQLPSMQLDAITVDPEARKGGIFYVAAHCLQVVEDERDGKKYENLIPFAVPKDKLVGVQVTDELIDEYAVAWSGVEFFGYLPPKAFTNQRMPDKAAKRWRVA